MDGDLDNLDREIDNERRELKANRERRRDLSKQQGGKSKAADEAAKLDNEYRQREAELKQKQADRDARIRKQQALQADLDRLIQARETALGNAYQKLEQIADGDPQGEMLKQLEAGKVKLQDRELRHQYQLAKCFRADLSHYWQHLKDFVVEASDGAPAHAEKLLQTTPLLFVETLSHLDKEMRTFEYGDPAPLVQALADFAVNAREHRDRVKDLEKTVDMRSGEGVTVHVLGIGLDGLLYAAATQLKTIITDGRLEECGEGFSSERALQEQRNQFGLSSLGSSGRAVDGERSQRYRSQLQAKSRLLAEFRLNGLSLDRCWSKLTKDILGNFIKLADIDSQRKRANIEQALSEWHEIMKSRHVDHDRLMSALSQLLISFRRWRAFIGLLDGAIQDQGKQRRITHEDFEIYRKRLDELRAATQSFLDSMVNDMSLLIRQERV